MDLGCVVFGFLFEKYQESVAQTMSDIAARVEALEEKVKYPVTLATIDKGDGVAISKDFSLIHFTPYEDESKGYALFENLSVNGESFGDVQFFASCVGNTEAGAFGTHIRGIEGYTDCNLDVIIESGKVVQAYTEDGGEKALYAWDKVTFVMTEPLRTEVA